MSASISRKLMKNIYRWTFTVITKAVVFVRIVNTTLKVLIVTAANPNSTDLGTSHSMQLMYANVSSFKIQIRYFFIVIFYC